MKETGKNQEIDNLIAEEMRTAFGYGKDHLIEEFDKAAMQMDEADRVPPEGEFEKIAAKVHAFDEEKKKSSKKVVRLKRVGKAGLLVAILGCVVLGIGASGKRYYEYGIRTSNEGRSEVWNNIGNLEANYELDEAYEKIKETLGLDVLKLMYIPQEMELTKLVLSDGFARMEFAYNKNYIYFVQAQYPVENSGNTETDCEEVKKVYNKVLKTELLIEKNLLPNKEVEYFTEFTINKTYYYLIGVISEEKFEEILKRINY